MTRDGLFHPAVAGWFQKAFRTPTAIQELAWPEIKKRENVLLSAPTGSGKTLAAFLAAIDDLVRQGVEEGLPDRTQLVYISPLKALSNDIEQNLQVPLTGILSELEERGLPDVRIRVLVRTGDTPASRRTAMLRHPPHILVTTPESLYILLTSENGRRMLGTAQTVIVDEIHALVGNKRGSHLALSLERLENLAGRRIVRIGLSATQRPIETVARFLTGKRRPGEESGGDSQGNGGTGGEPDGSRCRIIDVGSARNLDLALEVPRSPLAAVMANEVWEEIYDRLAELIQGHRTTLIFVNTRRQVERAAHQLTARLGPEIVTAHHGSLSRERRLDAESRLKSGSLRALVATSSLELGIDIGAVELVCQIGSPRSIAALRQRVGRSGHAVGRTPKGRIFPLSRDDLVECAALLLAVKRDELDPITVPDKPLDILAQQVVAEVASCEYGEEELYSLVRRAYPYRNLAREELDEVLRMLSEGYTTRRGRRGAWLHHDRINHRIRARRGARLSAITSGGAIPDNFDYDVILEPENMFLGTVNEDFAIESLAGDIFQLGNTSWRIRGIEGGKVRVEDAKGEPPNIPFWLGEAPSRTPLATEMVSQLRQEVAGHLCWDGGAGGRERALAWLARDAGVSAAAAEQIVEYMDGAVAALGVMPTRGHLVMERFFDEAGSTHIVIHSLHGSRVNRAWGLALRKRFCRKFNFELQAAATDDAIILSLGPTHSFPLEEVWGYLSPDNVTQVLTQALLDSPMFDIRWRWNATRALAILRQSGGRRVPPQFQRMRSEDLLALTFPDKLACLENIPGDREIPDHPLVRQTIEDCLTEAMDIDGLRRLLEGIATGEIKVTVKDLVEASPFSQEILNARPYAFLDDVPLEERRTRAVRARRWIDPEEAARFGRLDARAIEAVKEEAWPQVVSGDELHDALVLGGFLTEEEGRRGDGSAGWRAHFESLVASGRAAVLSASGGRGFWVAAERLDEMRELHPEGHVEPPLSLPAGLVRSGTGDALIEILRGRMEILGPVTVEDLAGSLGLPARRIETALVALESEGFVFRGNFTPGGSSLEWCERRLLARIHRLTLERLRREIEPVSSAHFQAFLFEWQRLVGEDGTRGPDALLYALDQLEGFEAAAASWEADILPARVRDYDYIWLDALCLSGRLVWGRFSACAPDGSGWRAGRSPVRTTPLAIMNRSHLEHWTEVWMSNPPVRDGLTHEARAVYSCLERRGASFFEEICRYTGILMTQVEEAIAELVAAGLVTSDSYTGLRALLVPARYRPKPRSRVDAGRGRTWRQSAFTMEQAGRWSLLRNGAGEADRPRPGQEALETIARALLMRYGVVFRKVVERERLVPPWRDLVRIYRTLEARGEVRGGRFIEGVWGEQYAMPEAISRLRSTRKNEKPGTLVSITAADPLNLTGILTPGRRIASLPRNRVLYRDGVPVAVKEGRALRFLVDSDETERAVLEKSLIRRSIPPKLRAYVGKGID
jgi:ATP-dependent Lhr-like helicase